MKILNIMIFGILITTNVYAGGVYGTLYDRSALVSPKGELEADQNKKKSDAKKEKVQRAEQIEAQRLADEAFSDSERNLRR